MTIFKRAIIPTLLLSLTTISNAQAINGEVHTWQEVSSTGGNWAGRLVIASPNESAWLTDVAATVRAPLIDFAVVNGKPFTFGMGFTPGKTDFNLSYILTVTQQPSGAGANFVAKTCVFNVTATSPAQPDIRAETYNGAVCTFKLVSGKEYFSVG